MIRLALAAITTAVLALPATAQTVDKIKETKTLTVGFRTDAPPLSYLDDTGAPNGYSVLVCGQVAQFLANELEIEELEIELVPVDATNRFDKVVSGEVDLLCGAATITLERRTMVDFSTPTYVDGTAVLLPKGAATDFASFAGQKIGVRSGTTTLDALKNTLSATQVDAELVEYETHVAGFEAMQASDLAAYFADQSILLYLNLGLGTTDNFQVMNRLLTIEKHGLAMAKGDDEFRLLVDTALSRLYDTGDMEKIFRGSLPGAEPGAAIEALFMLAPILP